MAGRAPKIRTAFEFFALTSRCGRFSRFAARLPGGRSVPSEIPSFLIPPFAAFSFVSDHLYTYADGLPTQDPLSLLLSRGVEAILRLYLPTGEGAYHALLTLLNKLGPIRYFYASSLFLYPTLVLNAVLVILLNLLISQLFI